MSIAHRSTRLGLENLESRRLLAGDTDCRCDAVEFGPDNCDELCIAGSECEIELKARLSGNGRERGEAELEVESDDDGLEIEFEVEVEKAEPGSVHMVTLNGVEVGEITINADGEGRLRLGSEGEEPNERPLPPGFPETATGAQVKVGTILTGSLGSEPCDESREEGDGQDIRFSTVLSGPGRERGEAEFEMEDDDDQLELALEVEVEKALPGSVHDVAVDGVVVAQITIDVNGRGRIRMATHQEDVGDLPIPDNFPTNVGADSEVSVGTILTGRFVEDPNGVGDENGENDREKDGQDIRFSAVLSGPGREKGEAEFEMEDDDDQLELELEVEVEKALPGSVHDVAVDGVVVAQITIDVNGRGRIRMATHQEEAGDLLIPDNFPTNVGADSEVTVGTILSGTFSMHGDLNEDRSVDSNDVDTLFAAIRVGSTDTRYDLDGDKSIGGGDVQHLVEDVIGTVFGDANMDGVFDSGDLVAVFQAGQYEDSTPKNSRWETGDWNGDGEFDSTDIVLAFQAGGYSARNSHGRTD